MLLVELGGAPVGLLIGAVTGLVTARPAQVMPVIGQAISATGVAESVLHLSAPDMQEPEATPFVLDPARLAALPLVATLRRLHAGMSGDAAGEEGGAASRARFLSVTAGRAVHLPLHEVREILPAATPFTGMACSADGMLGMLGTRLGTLPLFDLCWLFARRLGEASADQRFLVAEAGGRCIALRVERVDGITHCGVRGRLGAEGLLSSLAVVKHGRPESLPVPDMEALGARLAA